MKHGSDSRGTREEKSLPQIFSRFREARKKAGASRPRIRSCAASTRSVDFFTHRLSSYLVIGFMLHAAAGLQGDFSIYGGWLYISFVVNLSVCYAFYCLGMFYFVLKTPLAPFDPVPKFLCIKAVLFLSFWQVRQPRAFPRAATGVCSRALASSARRCGCAAHCSSPDCVYCSS